MNDFIPTTYLDSPPEEDWPADTDDAVFLGRVLKSFSDDDLWKGLRSRELRAVGHRGERRPVPISPDRFYSGNREAVLRGFQIDLPDNAPRYRRRRVDIPFWIYITKESLMRKHPSTDEPVKPLEKYTRYPAPPAAPPPAPSKERKPAPKKKRRKTKQAARAGAPELHDWEEGELFVLRELKARGNPLDKSNQTEEWKSITDVAKLVRKHLEKLSKNKVDYVPPDMSTTRGKVSGWFKELLATTGKEHPSHAELDAVIDARLQAIASNQRN